MYEIPNYRKRSKMDQNGPQNAKKDDQVNWVSQTESSRVDSAKSS